MWIQHDDGDTEKSKSIPTQVEELAQYSWHAGNVETGMYRVAPEECAFRVVVQVMVHPGNEKTLAKPESGCKCMVNKSG